MNILRKTWCRTYQAAFHMAQPLLPYKDPIVKESINDIPEILHANKIDKVVFVTDKGLVAAGLAKRIEDVLASAKIEFSTYSDTVQIRLSKMWKRCATYTKIQVLKVLSLLAEVRQWTVRKQQLHA